MIEDEIVLEAEGIEIRICTGIGKRLSMTRMGEMVIESMEDSRYW